MERSVRPRATAIVCAVCLLLPIAACGGKDSSSGLAPIITKDQPLNPGTAGSLTAERSGFALSVDESSLIAGGSAKAFELAVVERAELTEVMVSVADAAGLKALFLELEYDAGLYSPVTAISMPALSAAIADKQGMHADHAHETPAAAPGLLELNILDEPGRLLHGQILPRPQRQAGLTGDHDLAVFTFARSETHLAQSTSLLRSVRSAPTSDSSRSVVDFGIRSGALSWNYASGGDYDQNSEVNISDLTPLAIHFGEASANGEPFDQESLLRQIDGDNNGVINISDVTPIGQNFGRRVSHYHVYASTEESDIPAENDAPSTLTPIADVAFAEATGDAGSARLIFTIVPPVPTPDTIYWVRPVDETAEPATEGTPSHIDGPNHYVFAPETIALGPESGIEWLAGTGESIQVSDPDGGAEVEPGSVLVGVYFDNIEGIYVPILKKVLEVVSDDGAVKTVNTEPGALGDFLYGGGFATDSDWIGALLLETTDRRPCHIGDQQIEEHEPDAGRGDPLDLAHGERYALVTQENCDPDHLVPAWQPPGTKHSSAEGDLEFDFSGQVLYEKVEGENHLHVTAQRGYLRIDTPGFFVDYDAGVKWCESFIGIDYPCGVGLKYFRAGVGGGLVSELDVHAVGHYETEFTEEVKIYELKKPILIFLGPVPVLITLVLKLHAGITGDGSLDFHARAGYNADYVLSAGVEYTGDWHPFYDPPGGFTPLTPFVHLNGQMALNAYARAEFELRLYEIVGGNISLQPGLELLTDGTVNTTEGVYCVNWDLNGKAKSDLRLFAEVFGYDLFDESWNLLDTSFDIVDGHIGCGDSLAPFVNFEGTVATGFLPLTVTYKTSGPGTSNPAVDTFDPDGGSIVRYLWDLDGDGTCEQDTGSLNEAVHTYSEYGNYNISVWAVDDEGAITQKTEMAVVTNPIE